jgi:hypothetical protein
VEHQGDEPTAGPQKRLGQSFQDELAYPAGVGLAT